MKTIIKILLIFLLPLFAFQTSNYVFATTWDTDIKLEVQEKKITLNDTFNLNFSVNLDSGNNLWDVKINWIDKFDNLWQSSAFSFQSINWISKSVYNLTVKLKPRETWKFVIWPVSLKNWDKTLKSDTVEIEVGLAPSKLSKTEDKELTINDINDINWPKNTGNFSYFFIIIFFILLFFIGFYYLLNYYNNLKQQKEKDLEEKENENVSKNKYFIDKLNLLQKNCDSYSKSEFFALINDFQREFLEFKWLKWAKNMTFKELEKNKKIIDLDLFEIIKDTYFEEFKKEDNELDRIKILNDLKNKLDL